jgi:hypothetical protein
VRVAPEGEDFRAAAVAPNTSKIDNDVALRLRAADQRIASRRCIDWVGPVGGCPGHELGFTWRSSPGPSKARISVIN